MNTMKRFFTGFLAVIMVLTMAFTVFAATEKGTITVDNPLEGQTYTAYKIFDVTYNEGKDSFSYTIDTGSRWYTMVSRYEGITLSRVGSSDKYIAEKNDKFSAAAFAEYLKRGLSGQVGTELIKKGDKAVAEGLDLGYYFVSSTSGALCNLTTTHPAATIHDKNDMPFDKTDDKADVEVGETVTYTITSKVPDTTGFDEYTYEIADTMSEGLTFQKDVKVTVGGAELATGKYTLTTNATGFRLVIKVKEIQDLVGKEIKVTYTAVVNEKAVAVVSKNNATLKYSNDPTDTSKTTTMTDEETVYSAKIVIDKFEKDNETKKLAGAKFVLKNEAGNKYYKWNDTEKKVEWVTSKDDATTVTTDDNGAAAFNGLKNGTYKLEETEAPAGYNMLTDDIKITINGSDANVNSLTVTQQVANGTGSTLPETGGIGTTIFYAVGGVLVIGAAVLLVTKKRMSTRR